jgi:hypothetical protein
VTLEGIDVSYAQTHTPSLAGLAFAFARATYGVATDSMYATHAAAFRKAGIVLGAYAFGVNADGSAQARVFLAVAHGADLLALDQEQEYRTDPVTGKKIPIPPMTDAQAVAFIATAHKAGYKCGLYHSDSGFPDHGQDWNWVANWDAQPARPFAFWQHRGAPLDLDHFNGTLADLHKLTGTTGGDVGAVTDPSPKFLDLAAGVQLYETDGKTPLVKMSNAAAGLYSPFGNGPQRAVVVTTGGVTQVAFVLTTIATNVRSYCAPPITGYWTVNGKSVSSGSITY